MPVSLNELGSILITRCRQIDFEGNVNIARWKTALPVVISTGIVGLP